MREHLGLIELFVVLLFAVGWGVIELVALRLDRERARRAAGTWRAADGDPGRGDGSSAGARESTDDPDGSGRTGLGSSR
jgi:hypothetical protein